MSAWWADWRGVVVALMGGGYSGTGVLWSDSISDVFRPMGFTFSFAYGLGTFDLLTQR